MKEIYSASTIFAMTLIGNVLWGVNSFKAIFAESIGLSTVSIYMVVTVLTLINTSSLIIRWNRDEVKEDYECTENCLDNHFMDMSSLPSIVVFILNLVMFSVL